MEMPEKMRIAEKILKPIKTYRADDEEEEKEKDKITPTFLRKTLECAKQDISPQEFLLRTAYTVARNKKEKEKDKQSEQQIFLTGLKEEVKKMSKIEDVAKLMEYIVLIHTVKAKLGDIDWQISSQR
nr:hypothetical protein [Candidatus Sigynarchaeota archaeon]